MVALKVPWPRLLGVALHALRTFLRYSRGSVHSWWVKLFTLLPEKWKFNEEPATKLWFLTELRVPLSPSSGDSCLATIGFTSFGKEIPQSDFWSLKHFGVSNTSSPSPASYLVIRFSCFVKIVGVSAIGPSCSKTLFALNISVKPMTQLCISIYWGVYQAEKLITPKYRAQRRLRSFEKMRGYKTAGSQNFA